MKTFLFVLIFIRMSLDYSSQYFSVSLFERAITLSQMLGIGIAVFGIVLIISKWRETKNFPLTLPFLIIGGWGVASLPYSIAPQATIQELIRIFDLFTIGLLAFTAIRTMDDFKKLLTVLLIAFVLPITIGFYQFAAGIGFQDESVGVPRIFGTFAHPNVFSLALFATFLLGTLFFSVFTKTRKEKLGATLFLAAAGLALLLTFSRVAWVALFAALFLLALWRFRLALVPLLAIPVILFTFSGTFQDRVLGTFDPNPDSSITWRTTLWDDMIRKTIIDGNSVSGYGLGAFPTASEDLRGAIFGADEAHNDFVRFFVEGGSIGLAAFVAFLVLILVPLVSTFRKTHDDRIRIIAGSLIILLITITLSMLSDNVFKNTPLWWIFLVVSAALFRISNGKTAKQ